VISLLLVNNGKNVRFEGRRSKNLNKLIVGLALCLGLFSFNARAQNTSPFPASGNVGIGTTNPIGNLDVNAPSCGLGANNGLWIYQGGNPNNGGVAIGTNSNLLGSIVSLGSNSSLDFQTNLNGAGVDAMRLTPYGYVGIGTQTPGGPLDVLASGGQDVTIGGGSVTGTDRSLMFGAVIGKALGSVKSGTGVIEVGVTLQ
jgi:hypothetical protein